MKNGIKIVLTASATEMSDFFDNPFIAFTGGFPSLPVNLYQAISSKFGVYGYPPVPYNEKGAKFAPHGLRKIEACLLENGFDDEDVITVHPNQLQSVVGKDTKIVAISSMDPMGLAYVDLTYTSFIGFSEECCNSFEFRRLMTSKTLKKSKAIKIVGGAGAWQVSGKKTRKILGIDHIILGEGEKITPRIFYKVINGEALPPIIKGTPSNAENIPKIKKAALHGGVELMRGCGRNCQFCSPTMRKRREFSLKKIMDEVKVNVDGGNNFITLISEDMLLYGCQSPKFVPNREAVYEMAESIGKFPGVDVIQPVHISLAAAAADPELMFRISEVWRDESHQIKGRYHLKGKVMMTAETGVETGSPRILEKFMRGKPLPFTCKEWPEIVVQACGILNDNDWIPLTSFLLDMPGETEDDTMKSIELVDEMRNYNVFLMPVLFVPLGDCVLRNARKANWSKVSDASYELFIRCWEYNVEQYKQDFLKGSMKLVMPFVSGLLYWGYYRWRRDVANRSLFNRLLSTVSGLRQIC